MEFVVWCEGDGYICGEDGWVFRLRGWVNVEEAEVYDKDGLAFGYGRRICLGREIAMELYKGSLQIMSVFADTHHELTKLWFFRTFETQLIDKRGSGTFSIIG